MADEKSSPKQLPKVKVVWDDVTDLAPILADELNVLQVNDRVYLTFAQVRFPLVEDPGPAEVVAHIRPMVRIAVSKDAWAKMLQLLNNMASKNSPTVR